MTFDEALSDRVRDLVHAERAVTEKRMFGGLAFLINGNMAVSASGQGGLLLRVDPAESEELASRPHAQVAVMRGREMAGWLRVDADGVRTRPQLESWVARGVAYARSLPPKKPG
jgi:TfoX/Sxy family transcriptional regulator of competence genes